jgi:hypothetical protein
MLLPVPTIDSIAQQLGPRKGVWWAVQSAKKVPGTPQDHRALSAAEAWVKNPNPATHAAAASAAGKSSFQSPGSWAAQAAAWSHPHGAAAPAAGGAAGSGGGAAGAAAVGSTSSLVPHAVAGSVKLSAALASGQKLPISGAPGTAPVAPGAPAAVAAKPGQPGAPAVAGAKPPANPPTAAEQAMVDKIHQPFIELGKDILSGKNIWT